jgi:hypothetical protein
MLVQYVDIESDRLCSPPMSSKPSLKTNGTSAPWNAPRPCVPVGQLTDIPGSCAKSYRNTSCPCSDSQSAAFRVGHRIAKSPITACAASFLLSHRHSTAPDTVAPPQFNQAPRKRNSNSDNRDSAADSSCSCNSLLKVLQQAYQPIYNGRRTSSCDRRPDTLRENGTFLSFPYVCPEPVLVK